MSTTVTYKGNTIATVNNNTKTLTTSGKYLEDNITLTDSSTVSLQDKSVTPSESQQSITADNGYDGLDTVTVGAISSSYIGSGITQRSSTDLLASGDTITVPSGYYENDATKAVASGTAGTPTATKGTASNGSISVTPSVTNTTGFITGSTISGTAVTVSASELDSGTKTITANGTGIDVVGYATVDVNVSGGGFEYETGTYTAAADGRPEISFAKSHSTAPDILIFADTSASAPSTGNTLLVYCRFDYQSLFGAALAAPTAQSAAYGYGRLASNLNYASALTNDTRSDVTSSGFKPFAGTVNFTCKSGQTYKWIAIWK